MLELGGILREVIDDGLSGVLITEIDSGVEGSSPGDRLFIGEDGTRRGSLRPVETAAGDVVVEQRTRRALVREVSVDGATAHIFAEPFRAPIRLLVAAQAMTRSRSPPTEPTSGGRSRLLTRAEP